MSAPITFEEIEEQIRTPSIPKVEDIKVPDSSDGVPAELKGKNLKDVFAEIERMKSALKASEEGRALALAAAQRPVPTPTPPPPPAAPAAPEPFDPKKYAELMKSDPAAAFQYGMQKQTEILSAQLEARLAPVTAGAGSAAEAAARAKYPEEFAVLGEEIKFMIEQVPQEIRAKTLAVPEAWDNVVQFARGRHIDKLLAARQTKSEAEKLAAAQRGQASSSATSSIAEGGSPPIVDQGNTPKGAPPWDATTQEIAEKLGFGTGPEAKANYYKWYGR